MNLWKRIFGTRSKPAGFPDLENIPDPPQKEHPYLNRSLQDIRQGNGKFIKRVREKRNAETAWPHPIYCLRIVKAYTWSDDHAAFEWTIDRGRTWTRVIVAGQVDWTDWQKGWHISELSYEVNHQKDPFKQFYSELQQWATYELMQAWIKRQHDQVEENNAKVKKEVDQIHAQKDRFWDQT